MKKRTKEILLVVVSIVLFLTVFYSKMGSVRFGLDSKYGLKLVLKCGVGSEAIYPWYNEKEQVYYFFLPSFVKDKKILTYGIRINDMDYRWPDYFCWDKEQCYNIDYGKGEIPVKFMKSANIPAVFMETDSGSMEYLNEDKAREEAGKIRIMEENGNTDYHGGLKRISARGNSTFFCDKKSYAVTLDNSRQICGMEAGDRWDLLALYYEHDKIHSHIIYDMARYIGLGYTPHSEWVDLYCNGEYKGLYLLIEHIMVGENRVNLYDLEEEVKEANPDINMKELIPRHKKSDSFFELNEPEIYSGGYLLEIKSGERLNDYEAYFPSSVCEYEFFSVRAPEHATKNQLQYIKSFINGLEYMITTGDMRYKDFIDEESFAKQFLIDKITLEVDAMRRSTFFYKNRDEDILSSGPLWDYDKSVGEVEDDYTMPINELHGYMNEWYLNFYEDPEFRNFMIENYKKLLPYMDGLLAYGIDGYVERLKESIAMDEVIMGQYDRADTSRSYENYDSYVKYLKFYLANRLNFLSELWQIDYPEFKIPSSTGAVHTVTFFMDDNTIVGKYYVTDGMCMDELPLLEGEQYEGWQFNHNRKLFNERIPVYEDLTIYEMRKEGY